MSHDISLLDSLRSLIDFTEGEGLSEADAVLRGLLVDVARAMGRADARGDLVRPWTGGPMILRAVGKARLRAGNLSEPPSARERRETGAASLKS